MKEFIGKVCQIMLLGDGFGITERIIDIEGNWIKIREKEIIRILNKRHG